MDDIYRENEELSKELERIKHGIKTGDICLIVDGNDMADWGWVTQNDRNTDIRLLELKIQNLMREISDEEYIRLVKRVKDARDNRTTKTCR